MKLRSPCATNLFVREGILTKKRLFHGFIKWAQSHQVLLCVSGSVVILAGLYSLLFFLPRNVELSYASSTTCISWPTLLPTLQRADFAAGMKVASKGGLHIGDIPLLTTQLCAQPGSTMRPGTYTTAFAPMGWPLFRQQVTIRIAEPPRVKPAQFDKPIGTTKPLLFFPASPDVLSTYTLKVGNELTDCKPNDQASIACDVPALNLRQGAHYSAQLLRSYGKDTPVVALESSFTTLTATTIINGSVKPDERVYTRPMELSFTADKPLSKAKVSITEVGSTSKVSLTSRVDQATITVQLAAELPREKTYQLTITGLEAQDGSSLTEPYKVTFSTSGGPKPISVSVGKASVGANARIVVTFDQDISDKQDIAKFAQLAGGSAVITRTGNQVIYALQNLPLCTPFTLTITAGLENNAGVVTAGGWSYVSRTTCYTTTVYGYSLKGRALVAYQFGSSGPATLYVGAIHGNEPSSSGILKSWIDDLEANPSLYSGKRVVIVPTINPDGLAANTRTNSQGVNLNRNFPTSGWTSDINDTDGAHAGGGGSEPLSEPEARALASFTVNLQPRLLLSYHAVGSLVTGDPGGYSAGYASRYASQVGYRDATGQAGTFDYDITGAYEDWTYAKQGIPSMVIELGSYSYYSFSHHQAAMRAALN